MSGSKSQTRRLISGPLAKVEAGGVLWCRETWALAQMAEVGPASPLYAADFADDERRLMKPWRSPSHMPRWVSRITLEVTAVRREPLRAITDEDAVAEGATVRPRCSGFRDHRDGWSMDWSVVGRRSRFGTGGVLTEADVSLASPRWAFGSHWNGLHPSPDEQFEANPTVAVISFRRVEAS